MPIGEAFKRLGYDIRVFNATIKHPLDRYLFKTVNKTLWNLRLMKKTNSLGRNSRYNNINYVARLIEEEIKEYRPELVFFEIGYVPPEWLLKKIKGFGIKNAGWWTMTSNWLSLERQVAPHYDSLFLFCRKFIPIALERGFGPAYLPHGVNRYLFRRIELTEQERQRLACDIIFVGEHKKARKKALLEIAQYNIHIWGPKWTKNVWRDHEMMKMIKGPWLSGDELVKSYEAARIVLNINDWMGDFQGGVNQRVFDVPACGAFLLTDYCDELGEFYRLGEEIETFRTIDEMKDKVAFYLKNETARSGIARRGYERSLRLPGIEERLKEAMKVITTV